MTGDTDAPSEPVRKSVRVERPVEDAFRLFVDDIDLWWPVERLSRAADDEYGGASRSNVSCSNPARVAASTRTRRRTSRARGPTCSSTNLRRASCSPGSLTIGRSPPPRSRSPSRRTEEARS